MDWIKGGMPTHFTSKGKVDRRAELQDKGSTVTIDGVESKLERLSMNCTHSASAYALFEETSTGRKWVAVLLCRNTPDSDGEFEYAILPESINPPYYKCSAPILKKATPLSPGENPGAEEWRKRCWREIEIEKEDLPAYDALPEGAKVLWTVATDDWAFLPKGTRLMLVKAKGPKGWIWKDASTGTVYDKRSIPKSDYEVI